MMWTQKNKKWFGLTLLCVVVILIKTHYSTASTEQLDWMLKPTVLLVQSLSGIDFDQVTEVGYVNPDEFIVIAKPCAGINFFVLILSLTYLSYSWQSNSKWQTFKKLIKLITIVYLFTVITNTLRILLAIPLHKATFYLNVFTHPQIHRIIGIVVYFSMLLLYYSLMTDGCHLQFISFNKIGIQHKWLIPFLAYLSITILLPIIISLVRDQKIDMFEHFFWIIAISSLLIIPYILWERWKDRNQRHAGELTTITQN